MAGKITFTMIKPDVVKNGHIGNILNKMTENGFEILAMKYTRLTKKEAERFYDVHEGKPFFEGLVEFMSSGPIVAAILKKEDAVAGFRSLIGATDPTQAEPGTIRALYAESKERNAVHGSDSDENAQIESNFFFSKRERFCSCNCK